MGLISSIFGPREENPAEGSDKSPDDSSGFKGFLRRIGGFLQMLWGALEYIFSPSAGVQNMMEGVGKMFNLGGGESRSESKDQTQSQDSGNWVSRSFNYLENTTPGKFVGSLWRGKAGENEHEMREVLKNSRFEDGKRLEEWHIDGIMASIERESNFGTKAKNPNSTATGTVQWLKKRQDIFKKAFGYDLKDADATAQAKFIMYELDHNERAARDKLLATTNAYDAGAAASFYYVRPEEDRNFDTANSRGAEAQRIFDSMGHIEVADVGSHGPAMTTPPKPAQTDSQRVTS